MTRTNWQRIHAHLEATGLTTNGVGRRVQARGCKTCHRPVLAGYDADVAARVCHVDPDPLNAAGEALAVLTGRYTVGLWRAAGRYELQSRDAFAIAGSPPPTGRYDVLAQHRCHDDSLKGVVVASAFQPHATTANDSTTPPF